MVIWTDDGVEWENMKKKEAEVQRLWTRYLRDRWGSEAWQCDESGRPHNAVFELKVVSGQTLAARHFRPQQIPALLRAAGDVSRAMGGELGDGGSEGSARGLVYKISDSGMGLKPFDCFWLGSVKAYVVVAFGGGEDGWVDVLPVELVASHVALGEAIRAERCEDSGWRVKLTGA